MLMAIQECRFALPKAQQIVMSAHSQTAFKIMPVQISFSSATPSQISPLEELKAKQTTSKTWLAENNISAARLQELSKAASKACHAAHQEILKTKLTIQSKNNNPKDLVTNADFASESVLRKILMQADPNADFIGEESFDTTQKRIPNFENKNCWIVDPIDGTSNFIKGGTYHIAIAYTIKGKVVLGNILEIPGYKYHQPVLYSAILGEGAYRGEGVNKEQLLVSRLTHSIDKSRIGYAITKNTKGGLAKQISDQLRLAGAQIVNQVGGIYAALRVAAGGQHGSEYDAAFDTGSWTWDSAATSLIVTEAGGKVTNLSGNALNTGARREPVIYSTGADMHQAMLSNLPSNHKDILKLHG